MSIFALIGVILGTFASICVCMAMVFIFVGYVEESDIVDRLTEFGAKLARRRK